VFNIGPLELLVVLVIALLVLGPQRLPEVARSVGRGLREFRGALDREDDEDEHDEVPAGPQAAAIEEPVEAPASPAKDTAVPPAGNEGGSEPGAAS
jgi:sec-independent protein translocase protein TatA